MNLKYFIVFVAGMAALAGCQEASEYIPSIYITEAQRQEVKTITISQAGTGNILLSAGQDRLYGRRHVDLGIVE